tara:strand:+ start:273 stop:602 length:330 start_codon:yes stop_codon:yes gene_type:complete
MKFLNNPEVLILSVVVDAVAQNGTEIEKSCEQWGNEGNPNIPITINDSRFYPNTSIPSGEAGDFNKWFLGGNEYSSPWYIFLNKNLTFEETMFNPSLQDVINKLNAMLE